jgi:hypothetical protein
LAGGWLGAGGEGWEELGVEASPGGRFGLSVRRTTGGGEEDSDLEAWGARVGAPFRVRTARLCLFGGFELNDFSFEDRFDVDRGDAQYLTREVGLKGEIPLMTRGQAELSVWLAPAWAHLRVEVTGRTLVLGEDPYVEERTFGESRWEFSGEGGMALRWKALALTGGLTRRPALSSGTLVFVRVGVALIQGRPRRRGPV